MPSKDSVSTLSFVRKSVGSETNSDWRCSMVCVLYYPWDSDKFAGHIPSLLCEIEKDKVGKSKLGKVRAYILYLNGFINQYLFITQIDNLSIDQNRYQSKSIDNN